MRSARFQFVRSTYDTFVGGFDSYCITLILVCFEHNLLANPAAFGLPAGLNTTTPCQIVGGGTPQLANCANSLYFDAIHPTAQVHAVIAGAILTQLRSTAAVPEPATWLAMLSGFALIGVALRRRSRTPVIA